MTERIRRVTPSSIAAEPAMRPMMYVPRFSKSSAPSFAQLAVPASSWVASACPARTSPAVEADAGAATASAAATASRREMRVLMARP